MKGILSKIWMADIAAVLVIIACCYGLSSFLLNGNFWDVGYQDWIFHAFKVESLQLHGFSSWDHIWSNGMSYWRAYQPIPYYFTLFVVDLTHLTIPKAMMVIGVAFFILLRLSIYLFTRLSGYSPLTSLTLVAISLTFSPYWNEMKDYTITFGILCIPGMIYLWQQSWRYPHLRYAYVAATGALIYFHPLAAVACGGLWLFSALWQRTSLSVWMLLQEVAILCAISFFYVYELLFADKAYAAPYQLSRDFLEAISRVNSELGLPYLALLAIAWFVLIFKSSKLSKQNLALLCYTTLFLGVIYLNIHTRSLDFLNKFQLVRATFFIAIASLFIFGHLIQPLVSSKQRLFRLIPFILIAIGLSQAFADTSIYAPKVSPSLPDPVLDYSKSHPLSKEGSIYIVDSVVSSYDLPDYQFANGYNEHLLPQLVTVRLRDLLTVSSPDQNIDPATLALVKSYVHALNITTLFLSSDSPFIESLTQQDSSFAKEGTLANSSYNLTVLSSKPTGNALTVSEDTYAKMKELQEAMAGQNIDINNDTAKMDEVIQETSDAKTSNISKKISAIYPSSDTIQLPLSKQDPFIYLNESYSRHWSAPIGVKISKAPDNMILLDTTGASGDSITLKHGWGNIIQIQFGLWGLALLFTLVQTAISIRRRPHA